MSITSTLSGIVKGIASVTYKITKATITIAYRILTALVGIVFLPGAYIMRGKFLRGIVVTLILILTAVIFFPALLIVYPMAVADAATCD